ncbi:WD40 repeat domain-containing serine/threonine protein kinase [Sandaracinus amylolyticus]|uniref:High-affnity carbon uptake protein Hat/HatR n=1 Tax=Sandaracinus amylolyticus TaxID=927083 RepID=A0A0F6VZT4_9BACT|nr:WD40 repeat domain-containing serine/threonine-protein kinase [Sandaracinus amylolyticus]AKF03823.1 High-affnity carbon uptake protein Hat/HatR [Sandaracinus amylolyticus]
MSDRDPALAETVAPDVGLAPTITPAEAGLAGAASGAPLLVEHPGRYRRESEIGRGGMGRVVLVSDAHLGREVAMKELLAHGHGEGAAHSVGAVARFLREARVTGQLEHPGIVPVHELGRRADGTLYYTMKRIRGRSLASVLKDASGRDERLKLISSFRDVCQAIAYAHSRGVVHRDLKPDNVMVGEFGETLVVDWGLAKVRGEGDPRASEIERRVQLMRVQGDADAARTIDGHAIGTPAYMAPEQARGDVAAIDERTDVWGLGAILFEILTGRPPYTGSSALDVLSRVLEERVPRVRELEPDAPPELAAIADRALMKDPSSRYPGAAELAAEIAAYQDGGTVRAYEYSALELVRRFVKRHRAATIATITIALSIVAASMLVYQSYLSEQHARRAAEARRDEAITEREHAVESALAAEVALAEALLERAERALADGDPAGAAIYAAGALARDPTAHGREREDVRARERVVRAFTLYLEADASRQYAFERRVPGAHARGVLSTGGRTIAVPTESGLRLVDVASGSEQRLDLRAERVRALDEHGIAVIAGSAPGIYDLERGARLVETPTPNGASIVGGRIAVSCSEGEVLLFDVEGARMLERFSTARRTHAHAIWSPLGDRLAITSTDVMDVELWPWPRQGEPLRIPVPAPPYHAAFSPRGDRLAIQVTDAALVVATLSPALQVAQIPMRGWATSITWDAAGLVATVEDGDRIALRDPESGAAVDTLHVPASSGGRIDAGGARLVYLPSTTSSTEGATVFRRVPSVGRDLVRLPNASRDLVVDAPRRRIVSATLRAVYAIDVARSRLGATTMIGAVPGDVGLVSRIAVAPDGAVGLVTSRGAVLLFEPDASEARVVIAPHASRTQVVLGIAFDATGDQLLAGTPEGGAIRRWIRSRDAEGTPLEGGHDEPVVALALSPDGETLASGSLDDTVRLWDVRSGRAGRVLEGHEDLAASIDFSPDGARIATADGQGWVRVFRVASGERESSFRAHDRWVNRVSWASDGRHLVTAADDRTVRVSRDERVLRIVRTSATPISAELEPSGAHLVFHDGRDVIRLEARLEVEPDDPARLLDEAERRAGVRLDGLALVARD